MEMELVFSGAAFQLRKVESPETDGGDGCTAL
jgi:hypothetical protein